MKYSSLRLLVFPFLFFIFLIDSQLSTLFTTVSFSHFSIFEPSFAFSWSVSN